LESLFEEPMLQYNKDLKGYSRELRKNMTDAEKLLWSKIRYKQLEGYQFYRQKIVGNYIVDFYCPRANLVVEVDGGQHYINGAKRGDRVRDNYMVSLGLRVLRFSDREVFGNIEGATERILENL
jgi:very-short-patch-repair endonuclease